MSPGLKNRVAGAGRETVAAVVVTWNSQRDIARCLESLLAQIYPIEEIIVVDNDSRDDTRKIITENFDRVHLVPLGCNAGFARANNVGISKVDADWILTLNPDAFLDCGFVSALLAFSAGNDRIGMAGGKLLAFPEVDNENTIDSTGIEIFHSRRVRDRGMGEPDDGRFNSSEKIFGVCAAAALYRNRMLEDLKISGEVFPERFFAYYEDADLAWRAWRRGWEAWFVPGAVGWHRRGGSPVGSKFSRIMTHRNRLWLIARNEKWSSLIGSLPEVIGHETLMLLRMLRYPYLVKALFESLAGLQQAVRERKLLENKNEASPPFGKGIGFRKRTS